MLHRSRELNIYIAFFSLYHSAVEREYTLVTLIYVILRIISNHNCGIDLFRTKVKLFLLRSENYHRILSNTYHSVHEWLPVRKKIFCKYFENIPINFSDERIFFKGVVCVQKSEAALLSKIWLRDLNNTNYFIHESLYSFKKKNILAKMFEIFQKKFPPRSII